MNLTVLYNMLRVKQELLEQPPTSCYCDLFAYWCWIGIASTCFYWVTATKNCRIYVRVRAQPIIIYTYA